MEAFEEEVQALERAEPAGSGDGEAIAFYGSSSIRLWDRIDADLGDPRIVNLGFGGSTLEACAFYFERLIVPRRPRSLVLYAGDNDLGEGQSPIEVLGSFRELSRKLDDHLGPIPFAFVSIKPSPARWSLTDSIRSANKMIRREIISRQNSDYIDVFGPMLDPVGLPRPELYAEDGLHLSPEGYQLWAAAILMHRDTILTS